MLLLSFLLVHSIGAQSFSEGSWGFLENKGQVFDQNRKVNNEVRFLLVSKGMNVQLKKNSFSYDTYESSQAPVKSNQKEFGQLQKFRKSGNTLYRFHRVDISFEGANPSPLIETENKSESHINFYTSGNDISAHYFRRVTYKNLYPGIDLVFDAEDLSGKKGFEYYFVVKPGADLKVIKLKYKGAETKLRDNKIVIQTKNRQLEERIPASFLVDAGKKTLKSLSENQKITVYYKSSGQNSYQFEAPAYDRKKTLVIDPTPDLVWGTYYGGPLNDIANAIDRDDEGNIYVGGFSGNPNLATAGAHQVDFTDAFGDCLFGKFTSDGRLLWMTYMGDEGDDFVYGIKHDKAGFVYIAGMTMSKTGIATAGAHQTVHGNTDEGFDGFIAKFSSNGKRIWSTYLGGEEEEIICKLSIGKDGRIYVAGMTTSTTGIATAGSYQPAYASDLTDPQKLHDGFLACFENNGARIWSTYYGGSNYDIFLDMSQDENGNIYAFGHTRSPGLASTGAFDENIYDEVVGDAILVKFGADGKRIWSTYFGNSGEEQGWAVTCDSKGNVIIGGMTTSATGITTTGTHQAVFKGGTMEGFVSKFNGTGQRLWSTYYGGTWEETVFGLACDKSDNIFVMGYSISENGVSTADAYQEQHPFPGNGNWSSFIAKLTPSGTRKWGTYYGLGNLFGSSEARAGVADDDGNLFVCGVTMNTENIATCNAVQKEWGGNQDMFIAMFSETIQKEALAVSIQPVHQSPYCAGTMLGFQATAINGGLNPVYQWKVNGVNAGTNSSQFSTDQLKNNDSVSCTVTSSSPCVADPVANSNIITMVIAAPVVPELLIKANQSFPVCQSTPVVFQAEEVNGGTAPVFQWKINGINKGTNSRSISLDSLNNADVVTCEMTVNGVCTQVDKVVSNKIVVSFTTAIYPLIRINADKSSVCSGEKIVFTSVVENAGLLPKYQWKVNGVVSGTGQTFETSQLHAGDSVHCVIIPDGVTCADANGIASTKIGVEILSVPEFRITPVDPVISPGDSIRLSVSGSPLSAYSWSPAINISDSKASNPFVWPPKTQVYQLEGTAANGCSNVAEVRVSVYGGLFIPNAFTPNNDGLNDFWHVKGLEIYPDCRVTIYNRFGQLVFQSTGYTMPWDGKWKNQVQPVGVFTYMIDLKNNKRPVSGTITIIR